MNFLHRSHLPFPVSKIDDISNWTPNRVTDEYAASPVDVIRSFLREQDLIYTRRNRWNDLFLITSYTATTAHSAEPPSNSLAYLVISAPMNLLEWERLKLLEWRQPDEFFETPHLPDELLNFDFGDVIGATYELMPAVDADADQQLSFPLQVDFSPSKDLIDLWAASVRTFAADAELAQSIPAIPPSELALRQEFIRTLKSTLGIVAQQLRYDGSFDVHITREGRFTRRLQLEVCEQFLIDGYEVSAFLKMLGQELSHAVALGAKIQGAWGRVQQDGAGDLVYELAQPNIARDASFERSTRVE